MEEDNSTQHEEDSVVPTDMRQKQDHDVEAKSAFPKASTSCYNTDNLTFEKTL